jgi:hypothetical protein
MLRALRQFDRDLNSRQQPQVQISFDECAADAQVRKPAGPHGKRMPGYANRYVDANSFAPSMFHGVIVPQVAAGVMTTKPSTSLRLFLQRDRTSVNRRIGPQIATTYGSKPSRKVRD